MARAHQLIKLSTLISALALVGCASIADIKPGTSYNDVVKQFGKAAVSCPTENGGTREIWTEEPSGEYAWALTIDRDGKVGNVTQVLHKEAFNVLNQGQWNTESIRCQFGPPARVKTFADNPNQMVWEYRFYGVGYDYDMLFVTFDRATNNMVSFSTGPDPELNTSLIGK
ncbi:MAG: hypothetical protein LRY53_07365 [Burkholderiaceae bacterium]|nr:hypothetical protein [Burkholderiaceae bacterium]MCD8538147.1 hypothetical protein [Burkholderiaceae bacterium]MCD8565446.1 hypothetical protein [Burkholderiaceae bacterium]